MKAFLILEDGHVFKGTSIGSTREVISEIVFNTMFAGYHLCYLYKSNTMLKHTAVVRPSGWRRKASKERCFMQVYAIAFSVKIQTSLVRIVCLPMTDCMMNSRKALLSMLSIRKATAMTSSRLYTS